MAVKPKNDAKNKKKDEELHVYDVEILKVKDFSKDGKTCIAVDLQVNGVKIYGCWYRVYEDRKKPGEEKGFISFPSRQGSDGKYYQYAWFPISEDLLQDLEKQIETMLG